MEGSALGCPPSCAGAALAWQSGWLRCCTLDVGLDWLRYVTPFSYADAPRIFAGEPVGRFALTGGVLGCACAAFGLWWYGRKDIAA